MRCRGNRNQVVAALTPLGADDNDALRLQSLRSSQENAHMPGDASPTLFEMRIGHATRAPAQYLWPHTHEARFQSRLHT